jgi:uncharacterized protein YjaG (DUF416 family)
MAIYSAQDAAVAFATYFHQLFKGSTLDAAVDAMKVASAYQNFNILNGAQQQAHWVEHHRKARLNSLIDLRLNAPSWIAPFSKPIPYISSVILA